MREDMTNIIKNYMEKYLQPKIQNDIDNFLLPHKDTIKIGCHIRGRPHQEFRFNSDIFVGCKTENEHMLAYFNRYKVKLDQLIDKIIKEQEDKEQEDKNISIFIFTDSELPLKYFIDQNNNKYNLFYYKDILRSSRFFKAEIHKSRGVSKDKIGENIIKELFTMNKMDYLISEPTGNVPIFVLNSNNKIKHMLVNKL